MSYIYKLSDELEDNADTVKSSDRVNELAVSDLANEQKYYDISENIYNDETDEVNIYSIKRVTIFPINLARIQPMTIMIRAAKILGM